jgi:hypothetical protein
MKKDTDFVRQKKTPEKTEPEQPDEIPALYNGAIDFSEH